TYSSNDKARVVIVGGAFAGVDAAKALNGRDDIDVTIIDKRNYNLFVPLLYQVASSQLTAEHIAQPLRHMFRHQKNVSVVFDEAVDIDEVNKQVILSADAPV